MEGDTEIQQEIVVAAVDEPGHGAEAFQRLLMGLVDEIQGGMLPDGAAHIIQAVFPLPFGSDFVSPVVQPGVHGVAAGEQVGMALGVNHAAAATHRKAHHGAVLFIGDYPILSLDRGKELLEKEILITPGQSIR